MRKIGWLVGAVLAVAWAGTATALRVPHHPTLLERCLAGRAEAWGRYEQCMQESVWKPFISGFLPDDGMIARCRITYAGAWNKLVAWNTAPCSGNRFVDNTDGTVTDNLSGLTWEKKSHNGDIHDTDNLYTWSTGSPYKGDGTAYGTFLTMGLNATGFAGAKDWRLPTLTELETIVLPEDFPCTSTAPCVPAAFNTNCTADCAAMVCSCTQSNFYWTTTVAPGESETAEFVDFYDSGTYLGDKPDFGYVRAVHGGL